jgi:hypothetical protein
VAKDRAVVLEVQREGRRSRYHRGVILGNGTRLGAEQCNVDQAGAGVRVLDELPASMPRPWTQICRRCFAGDDVLVAAALEYDRWLERQERVNA